MATTQAQPTPAPNVNGNVPEPARDVNAELLDQVLVQPRHTPEQIKDMAKTVSKTGMYGMTPEQAEVLMLICQAEGHHPMEAIRRYHIIENKPAMRADYMEAKFQANGGGLEWGDTTVEFAEVTMWHPIRHPKKKLYRVTLKELCESGVAIGKGGDLKANYRRHPRSMLRARVLTEGIRAIDPGVIVGMYSEEEVSDFVPVESESKPKLENGTDHGTGMYCSPEHAQAWDRKLRNYIDGRQARYLDTWCSKTDGEYPKDFPQYLCTSVEADVHLVRTAIQAGRLDSRSIDENGRRRGTDGQLTGILNAGTQEQRNWLIGELKRFVDERERVAVQRIKTSNPELFEDEDESDGDPIDPNEAGGSDDEETGD